MVKKIINIQPFNEYWMDCHYNSVFTIASYFERSYHTAAYTNCYSYYKQAYSAFPSLRLIDVLYNNDFSVNNKMRIYKEEAFRDREYRNISGIIKNILLENKILRLYVNLFHWIPNDIVWKKYNWSHYSLIIGFDESKKEFYALDYDLNSYGINAIPEDRLNTAFYSSQYFTKDINNGMGVYSPLFIVSPNDYIPEYSIDIQKIKSNANRLTNHLQDFSVSDVWNIPQECKQSEAIDVIVLGINKVCNRQIGNVMLIKNLYKNNYIDSNVFKVLVDQFETLKLLWERNKILFMKSRYYQIDNEKILKTKLSCEILFKKEANIWNILYNNILEN